MSGKKSRPPVGHKANLGRKWSDEVKQKISIATKGIKKTEEHKIKIGLGNTKNWIITKPDGTKEEIKNLQKYCRENNLDSSKMSCVASGIRKHHKKYICERVGT